MSSTINATIGIFVTPGNDEKEFEIETVVKTRYCGVSEQEARELHAASLITAAEMTTPAANGGAGVETDSDVPAANGGAGAEEYEKPEVEIRVWNAGAFERIEISLDGVPFKVFSMMLCGKELNLWDAKQNCLTLDEEHTYKVMFWLNLFDFPEPREGEIVDIKRVKQRADKTVKQTEKNREFDGKSTDFSTHWKDGVARPIIHNQGALKVVEVMKTISNNLAFKDASGTVWTMTHPKAVARAVKWLQSNGFCGDLSRNEWMDVSRVRA